MKTNILNEDGSINFKRFNLLTESQQIAYMKQWTPQQWIAYRTQTLALSEDEVFEPIVQLINQNYHD